MAGAFKLSAPQAQVLFANAAYYTAFASGDMDAMAAIWAQTTPVTCIHPGGPVIEGRDVILASWLEILGSGQTQGFQCHDAKAHVVNDLAWVTCLEVLDLGDSHGALAATNIFVRENGSWKLAHHQACPTSGQPQDAAAQASAPSRVH